MIKDNNYLTIQGFMITGLHLKGNELLVYALIYGFTQDGSCKFTGSINYIAEWLSSTRQTVINTIKSLEDKGLIEKRQRIENNQIENQYLVKNLDGGSQKIRLGVVKKLDPINNIKENNIKENNIKEKFSPPTFEEVKEYFASRNLDEVWAKKFYDYYSAGNWIDGKGQKIKSWKQKVIAVWDKPEYKIKSPEVIAKQEEVAKEDICWIENTSLVNGLKRGELLMVNIIYILRDNADKGDEYAQRIIDTMRKSRLTQEQLEKIKQYAIIKTKGV